MSRIGLSAHRVNGSGLVLRQKRSFEETRHEILIAAGRRFARSGYAAVRLKDIAEDVGVTAPLVVRYVGSKEALFREVAMDESRLAIERADLEGPLESLGHRLATVLLAYWLDRTANFPAIALLRSLDFEEAKSLFEAEFSRRLLNPLAEVLPGPDPALRAKMIASQAMGIGLFGLGVLLDPDAPAPDTAELERLVTMFGAAIQACITS